MKEITTIHIARTPYEIELAAKKALGDYLDKIAKALHDEETYEEVEARIVDILREHGVARGDVITTKEVDAITTQLGEPKDFVDESAGVDIDSYDAQPVSKRFFRDQDKGLLGGVLAGIANYFGVDAVWVRLGWVILTLISGGTLIVGYILLWVIMPPAKTAAEKLQSRGERVTLEALRAESSNERVDERPERSKPLVILLRTALVIGFGLAAFGAIMLDVFVLIAARASLIDVAQIYPDSAPWVIAALCIMVVCGLLFAILMILLGYMSAVWRVTKRLVVASGVIIVLGAMLAMLAIGIGQYGLQLSKNVKTDTATTSIDSLKGVSSVKFDSNITFNYHATTGQPHMNVVYPRGSSKPAVNITKSGRTAAVTVTCQMQRWVYCDNSRIDVYGPVLDEIDIPQKESVSGFSYETTEQKTLRVHVRAAAVDVQGKIGQVDASVGSGAVLTANYLADIDTFNATLTQGAVLSLGDVKSLALSVPSGCEEDTFSSQVSLNVSAVGKLTVNNKTTTVDQLRDDDSYCVNFNR